MCGICGVVSGAAEGVEPAVRRMMRAMAHRGPDDEGFERLPLAEGAGAGFGFRRLAIIDLSPAGHQPMWHEATGDCLIFNGEIYNHPQLRARLRAAGVAVRSTGDAEVLLKALALWGERALDEVDGMYAFAFYEARSRRILLARDHLGIKPLYVARARDHVLFASEVRPLLASGLVPADLDPAGIAGFLAYGSPQDPLTVHAHVRSLPAGSLAWLDARSLREEPGQPVPHWRFPEVAAPGADPRAVETGIRDRLGQTVADQCVADVPVGSFLSGGIDSAILAAHARGRCRDLQTFCVGFTGTGEHDETAAAARTARAIGSRHHETILDEETMLGQWRAWLERADRPSIDGLNTFIVSGAAKRGGATVALSGLGADELFGGYPQFRTVPGMYRRLAPFTWIPRRARRLAAAVVFAPLRPTRRERARDIVANCDTPLDLLLRLRRVCLTTDIEQLGLAAERLGLLENYLRPDVHAAVAAGGGDTFHRLSRAESLLYMTNTLLRDSDTSGMAHALEIRVPYLGRRFVEEVAALPGSLHAPPGKPAKHLLRSLAPGNLPAELFERPKTGFDQPIKDWMFGRLRDECEAHVDSADACPLFEPGSVRRLWDSFVANRRRLYWNRPFALVVLGSYLGRMSTSAVSR